MLPNDYVDLFGIRLIFCKHFSLKINKGVLLDIFYFVLSFESNSFHFFWQKVEKQLVRPSGCAAKELAWSDFR